MDLVKKAGFVFFFLLLLVNSINAQLNDLMIVEYLDSHSGNGGAIKIYNPTSDTVDLSSYEVIANNNGGSCVRVTSLSGNLPPGEALIGYYGSYTTSNNCLAGDFTFSSCGWNGDDHVGIRKNGVYVDMINNPTVANGPNVNGTPNGLLKTHIIRQSSDSTTGRAGNCIRYTSTSGGGAGSNSWPTDPFTVVSGWDVFPALGRCIDTAGTFNFQGFLSQDTISICQGDSALIGGVYRSVPGIYTDTLSASLSCDSIVEVTLLVSQYFTRQTNTSICQGDSVFLENAWQKTAGVYFDTTAYPGTCDTILATDLMLIEPDTTTITPVICKDSIFSFHGQQLTTDGTYYAVLQNVLGCDSIIEAILTTVPGGDTTTINPVICSDSVFSFHGQSLNMPGTYYAVLQNSFGCDSVIEAVLTVNPRGDTTTINPVICSDSSYSFHGQQLTVSGTYYTTLQNVFGCDSVIEAVLTVNPGGDTTTINPAICSDSTYLFFGQSLTAPGTYYETLQNSFGCDSVIEAVLTVYPDGDTTTINPVICSDSTYLFFGQTLTAPGTYYTTLQTANGCDSVIEAVLTVNRSGDTTTINPSICNGDTYTFFNQQLTVAGTYYATIQNTFGCDSVIEAVLTVNPGGDTTTINPTICSGESFSFNNQQLTIPGTYYDTLQNSFGCDSLIEAVLTVLPPDTVTINPVICAGDTFNFGLQQLTNAGTYYRLKQTPGVCDTVIEAILSVVQPPSNNYNLTACAGDAFVLNGINIFSDTTVVINTFNPASICDSLITYTISFISIDADFYTDQALNDSSLVNFFNTSSDYNRQNWDFGDGSTSTDTSPAYQYQLPGVYQVTLVVFNDFDCSDTIVKEVYIPQPKDIVVPNVFSPNGDGTNDIFKLTGTSGIERFKISIFNRWGILVFESEDSSFEWDGNHQNSICAAGVYYWIIVTQKETIKGFLTLTR